LGPRALKRMDTTPEAMSAMNIGMKNGEILLGPRSR
jgi:hypothetical protein